MNRAIVGGLALLLAAALVRLDASDLARAEPGSCADLMSLSIPSVSMTSAQAVPAGPFTLPSVARHSGSGDINAAASFTCGEPAQKDRPARR